MAEVWLARYRAIENVEKLVAVKRIRSTIASDQKFIQMFLDEARTAANLTHNNIVSVIDVGEDDGVYYLAMEYLPGRDLRAVWRRAGTVRFAIPWGLSLHILIDALRGLHYAHTKKDLRGQPLNIIHRDVSPQNIQVTRHGVSKVLDFGIARARHKSTTTQPGVVRGKAEYMSPEQATGEELSPRSDQFPIGTLLYELTTGRRLYKRKTDQETMQAVVSDPVPRPSDFTTYPVELEMILRQALAKNPKQRFDSCGEFADALENYLALQRIRHSARRVTKLIEKLFGDELDPKLDIPEEQSSGQIFVGQVRDFLAEQEPDSDE